MNDARLVLAMTELREALNRVEYARLAKRQTVVLRTVVSMLKRAIALIDPDLNK